MKWLRGSIVLAASLVYLTYVFGLTHGTVWRYGLGDWQDPYFINALLEHWYRSVATLADPSSPPMYFPVRNTLGYSHGLLLYAPFYVLARLFLHPFHAYTVMLFAVMESGIVSLYLLLRKLRLSFLESLLLTAFFLSPNVVHGETGVWAQRASVFLIPPVLLCLVVSARMRFGPVSLVAAGLGGMLSALMYVQDFYTAHFAVLLAAICGVVFVFVELDAARTVRTFWKAQSRTARLLLGIAVFAGAWALVVSMFGGWELVVLGVRLRTHDWRRPLLAAAVAVIVFLHVSGRMRRWNRLPREHPWLLAVGTGGTLGLCVFLWIYVGAYREHRGFAEADLLSQLVLVNPTRRDSVSAFLRDFDGFKTYRPFILAFVVGTVACLPRVKIERRTCAYWMWLLAMSILVLLIPLRLGEVSVWQAFIGRLPGFGVIRDPKRIISVYELALVLALAFWLARLPARSARRISVAVVVSVLLAALPNQQRFDYERPIDTFDRWVAAPIQIDAACRSFYVGGASREYMSRSTQMWSLYNIDATFVALEVGIPTLNGFSAWFPTGWDLMNPQERLYEQRVTAWIDEHGLEDVCRFDIDARTMVPRR